MEKIFQSISCLAEYSEEKKRVFVLLDGEINLEEYKRMSVAVYDFLNVNSAKAYIFDFRKFDGMLIGLNEWLLDIFRPTADFGIKFIAIVMNKSDRNYNAAIDTTTKTVKTTAKVFNEYHDAETWLDDNA